MNEFFDNRRILDIIWNRRIHFIIIGIIAVVLSAIFSSPFFITPKFKSSARVYPSNISAISEESTTEQMLEIMNSVDIKLEMMKAFNLDEVYKIDKNFPQYMTAMLGEYNKHVAARKTEFETVEIEILDEDPTRAKLMCDSLIHFYNLKVRQMHAAKNWEMVKILKDNMIWRTNERDSIMRMLHSQRVNYQILDFNHQTPEVTRGYMRALADGRENSAGGREIKRIYDNLLDKGAEAYILESSFNKLSKTIDSLKFLYDINISEAQKVITYSHIVENPLVPDKKAYPVRWIIVAFSLLSALFVALLAFIVLDFKK
jgi:capsular polysaccharide biosynthesis protein